MRMFPRWLLFALAVALPIALAQAAAWAHARRSVQAALHHLASATAERTAHLLEDTHQQLRKMALSTDATCSEPAVTLMRDLVYGSPYVRELGIVVDNRIRCTNFGMLGKGLPIVDPAQARTGAPFEIELIPPSRTLVMGSVSLLVNMAVRSDAYVDALIEPEVLWEFSTFFDFADRSGVLLVTPQRVPVAHIGAIDATVLPPLLEARESFDTPTHLVASQRARSFPVYAVAAASHAYVAARWQRTAPQALAAGAALSMLCCWFLLRLSRAPGQQVLRLQRALERQEFIVHYQPVMDIVSGRCVGCEALVRWAHPLRGLVPPLEFIPLAERCGLIMPMTEHVMRTAAVDMAAACAADPGFHVAMNTTASQYRTDWLVQAAQRAMVPHLPMQQVVFEITERALLDDSDETAQQSMARLRDLGVTLAVDDFGTGYASLQYLQSFPIDWLKIDKSFVDGIGRDGRSADLVAHVLELGRSLGLRIVAEGIETGDQAEWLRARGVQHAQGWLYARAMPADAFMAFLHERNRDAARAPAGAETAG